MQNAGLIREVRGVMTRFEPLTEEIVAACTQDGLTYAELSDALSTYGLSIEAHSVRIAELMKNHEHGILTTTTDKLLVDFATEVTKRVNSDYLKKEYPSVYTEALRSSKSRKIKVTIQPV